jgi:hypothetical protein
VRRKIRPTASNADKFDLYQKSAQMPLLVARFLSHEFQRLTGRPLRNLREDFCGTAAVCCEFVHLHPHNRAVGIDLDPVPLVWCRSHNFPYLTRDELGRITLVQGDVRKSTRSAELIASLNFSYCVFKTRKELLAYFKKVHACLVKSGVVVLDAFGGGNPVLEVGERTKQRGFHYIWEVERFDPITRNILCNIHFEFSNRSRIKNAFVYDWRLWTLPELQELLTEAGFRNVHVLWRDLKGKSQFGYRRATRGTPDQTWLAFVVAQR